MAKAPLRYCAVARCPNKVASGLCPEHQHGMRQQQRRHYTGIPSLNYGRRWQREAKAFLEQYPFCIDCTHAGQLLSLATEVDHERPHRGDITLFWDRSNWSPRCKRHHSEKTAREVGLGG